MPVLVHLLSVCGLVQGDGGDEDEAISALLHDALEDKGSLTSPMEISARFGSRVLELVQAATDTPPDYRNGPKPPWRARKQSYLEHVRTSAPETLRVTIADKVDNVRSLLADYRRMGDSLWVRFNAGKMDQLWFYRSAVEAYKMAGYESPLLDELTRLVKELEDAAG